jgi:nicotinic acid mononucleotide adenylyltransferase
MTLRAHLRSPSVQLGATMGALMYGSYGVVHGAFGSPALVSLCVFVALFAPYYSKWSNKVEEFVNLRSAKVTLGRLSRFAPQFAFNVAIFMVLTYGGVFAPSNLSTLGGVFGIALLTTAASQGMQYAGLVLANRDIGDRNRNVLVALSTNVVATAAATTAGLAWIKPAYLALGLIFGAVFFVVGLLSDLRAILFRRGGVGVFFGTFNPIHKTHLAMLRDAIESRGLEKIYLHSTAVPKLHADALARGEIRIAEKQGGMRVYAKTARADVHVNYFPTGSKFYEFETRVQMMRRAVEEAGLGSKVEVLCLPQAYERGGFYAVLQHVKELAGKRPIHGLHGSDLGGMWVRNIYDESGWLYPVPVIRRDGVSATAIRSGAKGLTTRGVQDMIEALCQPTVRSVAQFRSE